MSNKIFRYLFENQITGRWFRYDIIKQDGSNLSSPEIINMPHGFLNIEDLEVGFDGKPLGIHNTPIMNTTFYLSMIEGVTEYEDLESALIEPSYKHIIQANFYEINVGTIHRLSVANDNTSVESLWNIVFEGCQRIGLEGEVDIIQPVLKVQVEHLSRVILDQISMKFLCDSAYIKAELDDELTYKFGSVDLFYDRGSFVETSLFSAGRFGSNELRFVMMPYDVLFEQIGILYTLGYKKAIRQSTASFNTTLFKPKIDYYVPEKYNTNDADVVQNADEINLLIAIANPDFMTDFFLGKINKNSAGGLFHKGFSDSLPNLYTCVWDFLNDLYESNFNKLVFRSREKLVSLPSMGATQDSTYTEFEIDSKELDDDIKLVIQSESIKFVNVSFSEANEDSIEKIEVTKDLSRNEKGYNITTVFNNIPSINKQNGETFQSSIKFITCEHTRMNIFNLYRLTLVSPFTSEFTMFRLNEHVRLYIDEDFTNEDLFDKYVNNDMSLVGTKGFYTEIQKNSGLGKAVGDLALAVFSSNNFAELTIKLNLTSNLNMHFFNSLYTKYILDLSQYNPRWAYLGDEWICINSKLDVVNGKVELKLINKTYQS